MVQLRKRCPLDLAGVLDIPQQTFAKALACFATALARQAAAARSHNDEPHLKELDSLSAALAARAIRRDDGLGWGYEFDVQTRWAFYPAGSPNIIVTVFVARALATAACVTRAMPPAPPEERGPAGPTAFETRARPTADAALGLDGLHAAARYLLQDLHLVAAETAGSYFRYTETSDRLVHNANLLGAGLVAASAALRRDEAALATALAAARSSLEAQRTDGSWPYGTGAGLGWADNFHTAYNLDGLLQVWLASGDRQVADALDRGVSHWVRDFFEPDGAPRYYPHKPYPYDIHSAGTAIDVAARLATWGWPTGDVARSVASWTERHLIDAADGCTYYQKHRLWVDKRHFVRWGDGHWALGRSSLELLNAGCRDPLEEKVAAVRGVTSRG